jgi:hypothetical protein
MADSLEQKKAVIESRARIRELVFGVQDGLISTVGLLAGIQGATENTAVVVITGLTAMFSGAISMAAGSYLSSNAQKDIFDKELRDAEILAAKEPYIAAEGLLKSLNQEGLSRAQSYGVVKQLLQQQQVFLRTFQEKVFGLGSADLNQPLGSARHGGFLYAARPFPSSVFDHQGEFGASYPSRCLGSRFLQSDILRESWLLIHRSDPACNSSASFLGAAGLGYLIGLVVQQLFPGIQIPA